MKIKRFFATDIRQAMRMVKEELGADAVIMSNRPVEGGIEIIAARDFDEQSIQKKLHEHTLLAPEPSAMKIELPNFVDTKKHFQSLDNQSKSGIATMPHELPARQNLDRKMQEQATVKPFDLAAKKIVLPNFEAARKRLQLENERKNTAALAAIKPERRMTSPYVGYAEKVQFSNNPETPTTTGNAATIAKKETSSSERSHNQQSNLSDALLMEMSRELKYLRTAMDTKLANMNWANTFQATPIKNDLLHRLMKMGISKKLAAMIANQFPDQSDAGSVFAKAQEMLTQALPLANDNLLETGGIVTLVGPTGVGKTTTVAKLAAKFILRHGSSQVALITTDNYRIGAHEQLNTYGRLLDVPVRVASNANELRKLINGFTDKRLILIDTAGMSQRDIQLVEQINTLRQSELSIRSYLVMSAATEYKAMSSIIKAFSVFTPQANILTKLDEAVTIGSAISSIIEHNLPLSFITDGQQVPEDIHRPHARSLIERCVAELNAENDCDDNVDYEPWIAQSYA